jgi:polar amino acid transport system substrate-binding protein
LRRITTICFAVCLALLIIRPAAAQDEPLRVAIKPLVPFVFFGEPGQQYSGFSVDLWDAIAERMDVAYEWQPYETVAEVLDAVREGRADVGIAGISITREREEILDFSQPMFNAGLQIMTRTEGTNDPISGLLSIVTPSLLLIFVVLLLIVVLVGHVIWLVERRINDEFPDDYLPGVGEGIWWAAASMVGGSDKMPRSVAGRIAGILWMVVGIVLIAVFTANITTQNTLQSLQGAIQGLDDLPGKRIVTVADTTAAQYLRDERLIYAAVPTIEAAYELLLNGNADAIVYDAPVLQYYAATEGRGRVHLVGGLFERQDYGIALQPNSPHREAIDRALLALLEDDVYDQLYTRWFGTE